jgi:hypothetical protein
VQKWAIAGAASLVPVVGQVLTAGYGVAIARRVVNGEADGLPEWGDFGDFLREGLGTLVISLVYFLPLILISLCVAVPVVVVSLIQTNGNSGLEQAAGILGACLGILAVIYSLLAGMALMAALGRYAASGQIGPALNVGEVFRQVRAKPGLYLVVLLVSGLGLLVFSLVGVIGCFVGAFWGAAYAQFAQAHLIGQAQRYTQAAGAAR